MNPCVAPSVLAAVLLAAGRGSHPAPPLFFLVVLGLFAVFFVFAIRMAIVQRGKTRVQLAALAARLGLEVREAPTAGVLGIKPTPTVEGRHRNRAVRFFTYTTSSGKNSTQWCAVAAAAAGAGGFTLDLFPQNFLTHIGVVLGMQDIQVGDPAFDPLFVVKSNDAAYTQAALLPEIRARLVTERGRGALGHVSVKNGEVRYAEIGGFSRDAQVARLADMLEVVCDLAEVAEVYQKS